VSRGRQDERGHRPRTRRGIDVVVVDVVVIADTPADWDQAFELARRYDNWPVYDMVYVALAERLGTEFYTADGNLRARLAHLPWVLGVGDGAD
jgi:hypothetical protein